ncbi:hypothetical protein PseudUWO311_17365 [Pseudanabaena sp. UWO311]|nr:hypothetical protein PseudUWO311_17365 [Pseudanabaena sp. UWO311]
MPNPPTSTSAPKPPVRESLPNPPLRVLLPSFPLITLLTLFPVPLMFALPVRVKFSRFAPKVHETLDCTKSVP